MVHFSSWRRWAIGITVILAEIVLAALIPLDQAALVVLAIIGPAALLLLVPWQSKPQVSLSYLVPRQLPPPPVRLVGRENEQQRLANYAAELERQVVVHISGPAGIGKTALAVTFANNIAHRFTDGQLYAHLGTGALPSTETTTLKSVLSGFVYALQPRNISVPDDVAALTVRYNELTAQRKLLILLDEVSVTFPLSQLLPGHGNCMVITTGRSARGDLTSLRELPLERLSVQASVQLLSEIVSSDDRTVLRKLARACDLQPLALTLLGNALSYRTGQELANAAFRALRGAAHQDSKDPLDAAYLLLTQDERMAFRSISAIGELQFTLSTFAAALGIDEFRARVLADRLVDSMLLERYDPEPFAESSYEVQDNVREYAAMRARTDDPHDAQKARVARVAAVRARLNSGIDANDLRRRLFELEMQGSIGKALEMARAALTVAQGRGDPAGECVVRAAMAELSAELGNVTEAKSMAQRASVADDTSTLARSYRCLGHAERRLRQLQAARHHLSHALEMAEACQDQTEQVRVLSELAVAFAHEPSDISAALTYCARAEYICNNPDSGSRSEMGRLLTARARVLWHARDYSGATKILDQAAQRTAEDKQLLPSAHVLYWACQVAVSAGNLPDARIKTAAAIDCFARMRHYYGLAKCRKSLADAELADGNPAIAADLCQQALNTFHSCGDLDAEAGALMALSNSYQQLNRPKDAARIGANAAAILELLRQTPSGNDFTQGQERDHSARRAWRLEKARRPVA
jgi:tetratricopeptide (TPR) repeat protein